MIAPRCLPPATQPVLEISDVIAMEPWKAARIYLMAGWLYERRDTIIMTDGAWDALCRRLDAEWEKFAALNLRHFEHIDREELKTATASYLVTDTLPLRLRASACQYAGLDWHAAIEATET